MENGAFLLHGIDLVELCEKHETPLFIFDEVTLIENYERFRRAFERVYPKSIVCYSIKTNNNLAICSLLREKEAYAAISSELDLYVAKKAGFPSDHIIFDGPYKPKKVLRKVLKEEPLLINIESLTELERLDKIAGEMGIKQSVGLRINSFKSNGFFSYFNMNNLKDAIYCHPYSRFGFSLNSAYSVFERSHNFKNLRFEGIMTHPYDQSMETLLPIMRTIYEKFEIKIKYLNVGGGFNPGTVKSVKYVDLLLDLFKYRFGSKSMLEEREVSIQDIELTAKHIADRIKNEYSDLPEVTLVTEPGQYIVGSSGLLLLRVDHVKNAGRYKWVITNGGTNLVPIANIFSRREIIVVTKAGDPKEDMVNIAGPLLYSEDVLAWKTFLPKVEEGDILALFDCGAYTISSSTQFLYPRPAVVLLNSKKEIHVIREKETCEDILNKDTII